MRQMHHWAAMLFIAAMMIHLLRVFFTGAYRKPRELNWVIGCLLLLLGTLEGFTGYSLPDDLLSGTGVRAADGFMKASPVVGTYMSFFLFGGEFPGESIIPRLYTIHVLLIPGLLLALIAAHMLLLVYHKHTQWPGPGRTEKNVVGYPMLPVYAAKAGGFFFIVFGVTALHGRPAVDQPGVEVRALRPVQGDRGLPARLVHGLARRCCCGSCPGSETAHLGLHGLAGTSCSRSCCCRSLMFMILMLLPFLEAWITGDKREHHLLQRPRNAPTRTALMVALMTFYGLSWAAGGNDIIAIKLHLIINQITYFLRGAVFIGPLIAFLITRRWCISLQRKDDEQLLHGYETGIIMRSPEGGYSRAAPAAQRGAGLHAHRPRPRPDASTAAPRARRQRRPRAAARPPARVRAGCRTLCTPTTCRSRPPRSSRRPTTTPSTSTSSRQAMEGHAADGHQFDGHHLVEDETAPRRPLTDRSEKARRRHRRRRGPSLSAGSASAAAANWDVVRPAHPRLAHARCAGAICACTMRPAACGRRAVAGLDDRPGDS